MASMTDKEKLQGLLMLIGTQMARYAAEHEDGDEPLEQTFPHRLAEYVQMRIKKNPENKEIWLKAMKIYLGVFNNALQEVRGEG